MGHVIAFGKFAGQNALVHVLTQRAEHMMKILAEPLARCELHEIHHVERHGRPFSVYDNPGPARVTRLRHRYKSNIAGVISHFATNQNYNHSPGVSVMELKLIKTENSFKMFVRTLKFYTSFQRFLRLKRKLLLLWARKSMKFIVWSSEVDFGACFSRLRSECESNFWKH